MHAVVITRHGPPEVLELEERPAPDRPLNTTSTTIYNQYSAPTSITDMLAR